MLTFFILASLVGILILDYCLNRNFSSPIFIFCGIWSFIITLWSLQLFDIIQYPDKGMIIIWCGVLCFAFGCGIANLMSSRTRVKDSLPSSLLDNAREDDLHLNSWLLNLVLVLTCIGTLIMLFYAVNAFLMGKTYTDVRGSLLGYNDEQLIANPFLNAFITYFCGPAKTVLLPIAIVYAFNRVHIKFCVAVALCTVAEIVASGGRITLLYVILQLFAAAIYFKVQISKRTKKIVAISAILIIIAVICLTTARTGSGLWFSIYSYFSIPVSLFSEYMNVADTSGFHSFGAASTYPLFYLANSFVHLAGSHVDFLDNLVTYVGLPQNTWTILFPGRVFNAFCSMFYFFYLDFRIPGVCIFSILYGMLASIIFHRAYKKEGRSVIFFVWYLLIIRTLFGSFIIWQIGNTKFAVSVFILILAQITARKPLAKKTSSIS